MNAYAATRIARHLASLLLSARWSAARIEGYQRAALAAALQHAAANVDHYRRLAPAVSGDPFSDLARLPLLEKREIQKDPESFLRRGFAPDRSFSSRTSGSTGQPTVTWFDPECWYHDRHAQKLRRMLGVGIGLPARILSFSDTPSARGERVVVPGLVRWRELSARASAEAQLAAVARFAPTVIYAFPSVLQALCHAARRGEVSVPRARAVFTSSEVLTPGVRRDAERLFGVPIRDVYGTTEFKDVAWQCERGRYHVNFESVFVEVVSRDSDGHGDIVVSSLRNRAMPLLRFVTGDRGRLGHGRCGCGLESPWLEALDGRRVEMYERADGTSMSPYLLSTAVEVHAGIVSYQLGQPERGVLEVRVVGEQGPATPDVERIRADLIQLLGPGEAVAVQLVDAIEREHGAKRRLLIRSASANQQVHDER